MNKRRKVRRATPAIWSAAGILAMASSMACTSELNGNRGDNLLVAGPALSELSLDQLLDIKVTTVSKRPERQDRAAAAIYVLSGEEIRRSGARTLPEALRMVPGLQVSRIDAQNWSVTARGFGGTLTADKLEVVMDGRSLYTPLFSGVFWDVQDTFMEDIDRIEVIRGPGAALWGANAVNGVINIVTKSAAETTGVVVNAGAGNEWESFAGLRAGGKLGDSGHVRAYAKAASRDASARVDRVNTPPGSSQMEDADDGWDRAQAGMRADWVAFGGDRLTAQGDFYDGDLDNETSALNPQGRPQSVTGHNLLTRWTRSLSNTSSVQVQAYYDYTKREDPGVFEEIRDTYDVQLQHQLRLASWHDVTWGLGYRRSEDDIENITPAIAFLPDQRTLETWNLFGQDQFSLLEDRLRLTLGVKLEHNDFTGFEVQPSFRASYSLTDDQTLWGAASRAVRTPNRLDEDVRLFVGQGASGFAVGSDSFDSEVFIAYELGYRNRITDNLSADIAIFYNDLDDIRGVDTDSSQDAVIANQLEGHAYGAELSLGWQARSNLRVHAGYGYFDLSLGLKPGASDSAGSNARASDNAEEGDARHQGFIRAVWDIRSDVYLSGMLRYVDDLPGRGETDATGRFTGIDSYTELDLRAAWSPLDNVELAVTGRNLLDDDHAEFGEGARINHIERGVYGEVIWRY